MVNSIERGNSNMCEEQYYDFELRERQRLSESRKLLELKHKVSITSYPNLHYSYHLSTLIEPFSIIVNVYMSPLIIIN